MTTTTGIRPSIVIRIVMVALVGTAAGCSFLLDKDKAQCEVDADCAEHFDGHPVCQAGVCVDLGLGPKGCFAGTPTNQSEYLNACTTSKCVPFNNCDRLGLCPGMTLPPGTEPSTGRSPTLVNNVEPATRACDEGISPDNVIYLYGSADFGPLLRAAQPLLDVPPRYRAVFQGTTSCNGVDAIFKDEGDSTRPIMRDPANPANGGWAFYFDANRNPVNCLLPGGSKEPHIGISNLYAPTCNRNFAPGNVVAEYPGPVVPFVLSVPAGSSEESISAEALHFIFGRGGRAPLDSGMMDAAPWTDWNNYYIRNSGAGSTVLTALLADVDRTKFWGVDRLSTENLRDALLTSTQKNSSIGILSIDFNDKHRANLRALYLQAKGQDCGYQPDSSPSTVDKANVRDGHYPLWGYVHLFTRLSGGEASAQAKAMALLFSPPKLEERLVDEIIEVSLIPQCAMSVERTSEMGPFQPKSGFHCGCYFDFKTKGRNNCQACTLSEDCPSTHPNCNYGYCEVN